ncbi:IclR family transcriptional regulator [Eoetvoesiella caeni]
MPKAPSVISRVVAILSAFDECKSLVTIEEISALLNISTASAYRYMSDLTQAGLLSRTSGSYRLGPKVIELEYLFQSYDPILQAGRELMEGLAGFTGCNVSLCNVYDQTLVNVLHVDGKHPIDIPYKKGQPMPLFRGAQAHILLAFMDTRKLKRLYETAIKDPAIAPDALEIGENWQAFSKQIRQIRSRGYYVSHDQLQPGVTGIAAPVFGEKQEVLSSLVLVFSSANPPSMSEATLIELVAQGAKQISKRIEQLSGNAALAITEQND